MKAFDPNYNLLDEMYQDDYYPAFLVNKVKDELQKVIALIPEWLSTGLGMAGKMLPAIGFAMILNVMAKKELIPFVLLGYIAIAYMKLPVMGVAVLGTAIALLVFFNAGRKGEDSVEEVEVEFEDGI